VAISSTAGPFGYGLRTPYAAAKWGVIGLTKSLAVELGPYGLQGPRMRRVIEAEAEAVERGLSPEAVERKYAEGQSIPQYTRASEIADVCAFLASPQAAMVKGQVIAVDGHRDLPHRWSLIGGGPAG
jgi:NAD(P)-dependent dehydrogenase (short-subunit alcohol dehydrogenase family)